MRSGQRKITEGIELINQERIRTLGELQVMGNIGSDHYQISGDERKNKFKKNEYLRRTRKLLETKPCSRNLIKEINTWAVPLVRYSRLFLKWTREKLRQMDQKTKKLIMMHQALHPRDDIDREYMSSGEGGRGPSCIEDSVNASRWGL